MAASKPAVQALREWLLGGRLPDLSPDLAQAAIDQGLAAWVLAELAGGDGARSGPADTLRGAARAGLYRSVRLLDLGARARDILAAAGIRALPLKGAALGEWLYDSVALRPMLDADLLVLDAWPEAIQALLEQGYRNAAGADHARVFVDPVTGAVLELHLSVTSCPGLFPLDRDGLWSRSLQASGQTTRRPSGEDLLVQLALHASFQHGLVLSLVQWLDFRRLLEKGPLDVPLARRIAADCGGGLAVAVALAVAEVVVAAPVDPALRAAFPLPRRLGPWLRERLRHPLEFVSPAEPALGRVRWALVPGRRLRLVASTLGLLGPGGFRAGAAGRRLAHLLARFGAPTARSFGRAPS